MATYTTVQDIINVVSDVILEPWNSGTAPGPSLGIVSMADLLQLFSLVIEDFVNRTGLVWTIFSQQINFNVSEYEQPNSMNTLKLCFIGGVHADHMSLPDADSWLYDWRGRMGSPEYWIQDGLPPKTIELVLNPNYTGAGYAIPSVIDPDAQPPFGLYGLFNGAAQGNFTGVASAIGTAVTWTSGALFDMNWSNYSSLPNIVLNNSTYPIASITDPQHLVLAIPAIDSGGAFSVGIPNDSNLTMVGTAGLEKIDYSLDDLVPVLPDSFCPALSYGVLARVFSTDGEAKDLQRAAYCNARYLEYTNAGAAVAGEMLQVG